MKHVTIEIVNDEYPSNPRNEFDNISTFYGPRNSRYVVGGKYDREVYDLEEMIKEFRKEKAVIVEFESNAGTCYAVVERDQLQDEYINYGQTMRQALYHARQCAKGEVEQWLAYCNGEVYGYKITNSETGEELDSCYGFYGRKDAEDVAEEQAKFFDAEIEKEHATLERRMEDAVTL